MYKTISYDAGLKKSTTNKKSATEISKNRSLTRRKMRPNPEMSAPFLSKITFNYIVPLLIHGYRGHLEENDMYEPASCHKARNATEALIRIWKNEKRLAKRNGKKSSLFKAVMRSYLWRAFSFGTLLFVLECLRIIQPVMIGRLIRYFSFDSSITLYDSYIPATLLSILATLSPFLYHSYFYNMQKLGMELKIAASGIIMHKVLRLSYGALHQTTTGYIITMLSNDVAKFDLLFDFINYLWVGPFMVVGYFYMLWNQTGISCILGFITLVLLIPLESFFSRQIGKYRELIASQTDKRMSVMSEIITGIRVVKMYAWENAFANVIADLRNKELQYIKKYNLWQAYEMGTSWSCAKLIILSVVHTYLFFGNEINAERIFVTGALFNSCQLPLTLFFPCALKNILESRVSCKRLQAFLDLEEFVGWKNSRCIEFPNDSSIKDFKDISSVNNFESDQADADSHLKTCEISLLVEELSTTWSGNDVRKDPPLAVRNITFQGKGGDLIAVIGPVGSGKSSLLFSLLRETKVVNGRLNLNGKVAYVSQDSWLFSGTVRDNILFGMPFDEERYREAIRICCLQQDLSQFPHGDASAVGDRGHTLSGGQKARISLARAVYSNADIYLLDDPLSAVDASVARYLFKTCITGFLKTKLTILVTHQVHFLGSAKLVIMLEKGEMVASGTVKELKNLSGFLDIMQKTKETHSRHTSECDIIFPLKSFDLLERCVEIVEDGNKDKVSPLVSDELMPLMSGVSSLEDQSEVAETDAEKTGLLSYRFNSQGSGISTEKNSPFIILKKLHNGKRREGIEKEDHLADSVSWRIYFIYLKTLASPFYNVLIVFGSAIGVQMFDNFIDWWLNRWSTASEKASLLNKQSSSTNLQNVSCKANMTSDDFMDTLNFEFFHINLTLVEYRNIFTVMVLIFVVFCEIRHVWFRLVQVNGSRILHNRMFDAVVRSPVVFFSNNPIGNVLNRFSKDVGTMDDELSAVFSDFVTGVLEISGMVVVTLLLNPIILMPILLLCFVLWFLRQFYLASSRELRRLEATTRSPLYSHISDVMHGLPTVRSFRNELLAMDLYYSYQDSNSAAFGLTLTTARWLALVLDGLVALFIAMVAFSCLLTAASLKSGEVGLMLVYAIQFTGYVSWIMRESAELENGMVSLERIVNYTKLPTEDTCNRILPPDEWPQRGQILFQNVSLRYEVEGSWVLKDLTFEISPQEKIGIVGRTGAGKSSLLEALFRLTEPDGVVIIDGLDTKKLFLMELRKRLSVIPQDPVLFIGSLKQNLDPFNNYSEADLWSALEQVELKGFVSNFSDGLETFIKEGGANFSVGQRQLICLARAILRRAKILVIDEATANVDPETDSLIQRTIKANFADSTVLTVAHRLHTIMDSDKVMVLDDGCLVEFDHPYILLKNEYGTFSGMVTETGEETSNFLKKLAAASYAKQ